jgi:hypothetical protein
MSNTSGFEEVRQKTYADTEPAPRFRYGPREATGTLVNGICMSLGGSIAYMLEEISTSNNEPLFSTVQNHPIASSVTFGLTFRVIAYFLRNGGSSAIGDVITRLWDKINIKEVKND